MWHWNHNLNLEALYLLEVQFVFIPLNQVLENIVISSLHPKSVTFFTFSFSFFFSFFFPFFLFSFFGRVHIRAADMGSFRVEIYVLWGKVPNCPKNSNKARKLQQAKRFLSCRSKNIWPILNQNSRTSYIGMQCWYVSHTTLILIIFFKPKKNVDNFEIALNTCSLCVLGKVSTKLNLIATCRFTITIPCCSYFSTYMMTILYKSQFLLLVLCINILNLSFTRVQSSVGYYYC